MKNGAENSSRYRWSSLSSCISKNKFKGVGSSPAMPLQLHRYCILHWMNAVKLDHTVSSATILASQASPRAALFKEVLLFNHWNYYGHFKDQEAANLQLYGSIESTIKSHPIMCELTSSWSLPIHASLISTQPKNDLTLPVLGSLQIFGFNSFVH